MKNKKSTIGLMFVLAGSLLFTNCTKNKTSPDTNPDNEVATSQDAITVQMILSDLHEICGQICEANAFLLPEHDGTPLAINQGTNVITSTNAVVTPGVKSFNLTFNNTVGQDGHVRNGSLDFSYAATSPTLVGVDHYRQAGIILDITSTGYSIDNYTVVINNMRIENITPLGFPSVSPYFPSNQNIIWKHTSNVSIIKMDGTNTMTATIVQTMNKTLLNTNNTSIPMPSGAVANTFTVYPTPFNSALYMNKQYFEYTGAGTGTLFNGQTYDITLDKVTRNTVSTPQGFTSVNGTLLTPNRHPFLTGKAVFSPSGKSKRYVDFGESGDKVDYNGTVTIDGITYDVVFN